MAVRVHKLLTDTKEEKKNSVGTEGINDEISGHQRPKKGD
jgi:hypothetical protein